MIKSRPGRVLLICWVSVALNGFSGATVPQRSSGDDLPDSSDPTSALDLSAFALELVYEADFSRPLNLMREADLFENGRRVRRPSGADWILEGNARAWTGDAQLHMESTGGHLVLWNTREFPADFLLEFTVSPHNSSDGVNIVFFSARGRDGGSIFDLKQPWRDGDFATYRVGEMNCYHTSYWAGVRATSHIRKNHGFHLVAKGSDYITSHRAGRHRVRILKMGARIAVEVNDKISVQWTDDGATFGPVWKEGAIGLRQMSHSGRCSYADFRVMRVTANAATRRNPPLAR